MEFVKIIIMDHFVTLTWVTVVSICHLVILKMNKNNLTVALVAVELHLSPLYITFSEYV